MYVAHMKGSSPSHVGKGALEAPSLVIWTLTAAGGVFRFRPKHRFLSLGYDDDDDDDQFIPGVDHIFLLGVVNE